MQQLLGKFNGKSITGLLVAALVFGFNLCGVNIADLGPNISTALANFTNAAVGLVSVGIAVWGHIQLAQKHAALLASVNATPDPVKASGLTKSPLPLIFIGALCLFGLQGCATSTPEPSPAPTPVVAPATSTAQKIANDLTYAESLAVQFQTINTTVQADAPVLQSVAQAAGLMPANSKQAAIFDAVVSDVGKASGDVAAVNSALDPTALINLINSL